MPSATALESRAHAAAKRLHGAYLGNRGRILGPFTAGPDPVHLRREETDDFGPIVLDYEPLLRP